MNKVENTNRLTFELMDADRHQQDLFDLDQDEEVMRFINGGKKSTWEDIHERLKPRLKAYTNPEKGWGIWKVTEIDSGEYLGWVLVRPMHFFSDNPVFDEIELGWRFKQSSWGKGFGTEAAQAIADAIAVKPEVNAISAIADEDNYGSIGIMKKLGMEYVKTYVHQDPLFEEEVVYYKKTL